MLASLQGRRVQVELQDILALVAGYGMAAVLFRAFWRVRPPWSELGLPGAVLYLWLGLAMSGPIIMLRRRLSRQGRGPEGQVTDGVPGSSGISPLSGPEMGPRSSDARTTWAERAWLLIGAYWIVLGIVVIPARSHDFRLPEVIQFGLVPVVVAIGLGLLGRTRPRSPELIRGWTHKAAIALLLTWPLAWICLIYLGKSMQ